jgi:hypothetical protein
LILTAFAALLFQMGALVRSYLVRNNHRTLRRMSSPDQQHPEAHKLGVRTVHAMVILGTVIYLQSAIRVFEGLVCSGGVLTAEMSTPCYVGEHLILSVFLWLILALFVVAFPFWCLRVGYLYFRSGLQMDTSTRRVAMEQYAFLFIDIKPDYYWYRLTNFIINFVVALASSLIHEMTVRVFVVVCLISIQTIVVGICMPFHLQRSNLWSLLIGFSVHAVAVGYLWLEAIPGDVTSLLEQIMWQILGLWWLASILIVIIGRVIHHFRHRIVAIRKTSTHKTTGAVAASVDLRRVQTIVIQSKPATTIAATNALPEPPMPSTQISQSPPPPPPFSSQPTFTEMATRTVTIREVRLHSPLTITTAAEHSRPHTGSRVTAPVVSHSAYVVDETADADPQHQRHRTMELEDWDNNKDDDNPPPKNGDRSLPMSPASMMTGDRYKILSSVTAEKSSASAAVPSRFLFASSPHSTATAAAATTSKPRINAFATPLESLYDERESSPLPPPAPFSILHCSTSQLLALTAPLGPDSNDSTTIPKPATPDSPDTPTSSVSRNPSVHPVLLRPLLPSVARTHHPHHPRE